MAPTPNLKMGKDASRARPGNTLIPYSSPSSKWPKHLSSPVPDIGSTEPGGRRRNGYSPGPGPFQEYHRSPCLSISYDRRNGREHVAGPFWKRETLSSNTLFPLMGWAGRGRRACSKFLPSPISYPIHKLLRTACAGRWTRSGKMEMPSSNGHGPLIGWPERRRLPRSKTLPSSVLHPIHKIRRTASTGPWARFEKGKPRVQGGHGPFTGWPVRGRNVRSTFIPPPVLNPIHKTFKRPARWTAAKVHSPFAEATFFAHTSYESTT
jgi:hypothetical protein